MLVCLTDITGATSCESEFVNNMDRDNLDMASLVLNKFLTLYWGNTVHYTYHYALYINKIFIISNKIHTTMPLIHLLATIESNPQTIR